MPIIRFSLEENNPAENDFFEVSDAEHRVLSLLEKKPLPIPAISRLSKVGKVRKGRKKKISFDITTATSIVKELEGKGFVTATEIPSADVLGTGYVRVQYALAFKGMEIVTTMKQPRQNRQEDTQLSAAC